jgi:uncharacterized glyoxalase superfamily protein PhnB
MTDLSASSYLVLPVLAYVDPDAALPWLCAAFRFHEESRMIGADGKVAIADVRTSVGGRLMVGGMPPQLKKRFAALLSERDPGVVAWPDSVTVIVPDVDRQFDHVRGFGAVATSEPKDQPWGLRDFEVLDLEGRQWNFSQHLRDVTPDEWGATATN